MPKRKIETIPTIEESLAQWTYQGRKELGLSPTDLALAAHLGIETVQILESGKVPEIVKNASHKQKCAIVRYLSRLAIFLKQDPQKWVAAAGIEIDPRTLGLIEAIKKPSPTKGNLGPILETLLTVEDLEFLLRIQKELQKPMTLAFAYELLQLRNTSKL